MMRRRAAVGLLAGVLLAGLIAVPGAPAGAQDIADLPRLGYEITPDRGYVGEDVFSQVNPADVEEHCWNSLYFDLMAVLMQAAEDGEDLFEFTLTPEQLEEALTSFGIEFSAYWIPGDWLFQHRNFQNFLPPWPVIQQFIDGFVAMYGDWAPDDNPGYDILGEVRDGPRPEGIPADGVPGVIAGETFFQRASLALSAGTSTLGEGQLVPVLYEGVHVTTFVDPVTQEMVGATGNFNPETGEGVMAVPDLDPGLYAVAAACAWFPPYDELAERLADGFVAAWEWSLACYEAGGEGYDVETAEGCFPASGTGGWRPWAESGGLAAVFGQIVDPRAVGIDFYCILQPDGYCATPPGPVGLIDDGVLDEFNGDDPLAPGPGADGLDDHDDTGDLVAVQATPSFTG